MSTQPLTEREQQFLEHLQRAKELEVTLAEYARTFELDAQELYQAKRTLGRKGALGARSAAESPKAQTATAGDFVSVRVAPRRTAPASGTLACRIQHPSGLVIECASFPPASWIAALLADATDVPG